MGKWDSTSLVILFDWHIIRDRLSDGSAGVNTRPAPQAVGQDALIVAARFRGLAKTSTGYPASIVCHYDLKLAHRTSLNSNFVGAEKSRLRGPSAEPFEELRQRENGRSFRKGPPNSSWGHPQP